MKEEGLYSLNEIQNVMEQESAILQFKMKALVQSRDAAKGGVNVGAGGHEEEKEDNRAKALANAK